MEGQGSTPNAEHVRWIMVDGGSAMARRRMLDPSFFDDSDVSQLTRDERLFLLGCIRNSDDEGP